MQSASRRSGRFRGVGTFIRLCVVLLVIAGLIESYHAVKAYGNRVVKEEFTEPPNMVGAEQIWPN